MMRLLGIETSSQTASAAVWEDGKILGLYTTNYKKTHSQTLLPMIDALIKALDMKLDALDAIGVSAGPGSFTGLRIGSATAKGLAHVLDIPIISVNTLKALAFNVPPVDGLICPMMDARQKRVYGAGYLYEDDRLKEVLPVTAESIVEFVGKALAYNKPIVFAGDGFEVYEALVKPLLNGAEYRLLPMYMRYNSAASVAALAAIDYNEGCYESYSEHKPIYLKESQAEREYAAKHKDDH